jgi:hypothetical protein
MRGSPNTVPVTIKSCAIEERLERQARPARSAGSDRQRNSCAGYTATAWNRLSWHASPAGHGATIPCSSRTDSECSDSHISSRCVSGTWMWLKTNARREIRSASVVKRGGAVRSTKHQECRRDTPRPAAPANRAVSAVGQKGRGGVRLVSAVVIRSLRVPTPEASVSAVSEAAELR